MQTGPHPRVAAHLRHLAPAGERQQRSTVLGRGELQRRADLVRPSPDLERARKRLYKFWRNHGETESKSFCATPEEVEADY